MILRTLAVLSLPVAAVALGASTIRPDVAGLLMISVGLVAGVVYGRAK